MKADSNQRTITRTLSIDATPARVWRALTRPSEIGQWWPVTAKLQAKKGQPFHFEWGCRLVAQGKVLAARAPSRLALSWQILELEAGVHPTRVVFELAREGQGTRLSLEHSGFEGPLRGDDQYFLSHVEGWDVDLDELACLCETGEVGTVLVGRGTLASDRVQVFDRAVARLAGDVIERTEDEVVLALTGEALSSRVRLRVDLTAGQPELVVTETFPGADSVDTKVVYARWRRALRGSVHGLSCGTVYS